MAGYIGSKAVLLSTTAATVTGDMTVDTSTLKVDSSNNRVGIGTASPSYNVHSVTTSGSDYAGFFHNSAGSGNGTALVVKGGANNTGAGTFIVQDYSGNTDLMVDGNAHVTMPNQPAFSVHKNGTNQDDISASSVDVVVTWATELYDVNSDFDLSTETFTAPVTGKYQFNLMLCLLNTDNDANYVAPAIKTSNNIYRFILDPNVGQDMSYWAVPISVLADMDANDTCSIAIFTSGGAAQVDVEGSASYTWFTGYLAF